MDKFTRVGILCGLTFASSLCHSQNLQVLEAYVSDADGAATSPNLGDEAYVTVRFRATGVSRAFRTSFSAPFSRLTTQAISLPTRQDNLHSLTWGPFPLVMDRSFDVRVDLDPENLLRERDRSDNSTSVTVTPQAPATGLEYHTPRRLQAELSFHATFLARPQRLVVWVPQAISEGFQQVHSQTGLEGYRRYLTSPHLQSLLALDTTNVPAGGVYGTLRARTTASAARINASLLRSVTWADLDRTARASGAWLAPERYIESNHRDIAAVVRQALGTNRRAQSPFATAERLYLEVLRRTRYTATPTGGPSALNTLRRGEGDCGYLASLFVALCRNAGIPARTVNGFVTGLNRWHVWAEFHLPGHGWIPVDPAYAEAYTADGSQPLFFGVIPDLNERFATGFGFDRSAMRLNLPMLQSPALFWFGSGTRLDKFEVACSLALDSAP